MNRSSVLEVQIKKSSRPRSTFSAEEDGQDGKINHAQQGDKKQRYEVVGWPSFVTARNISASEHPETAANIIKI